MERLERHDPQVHQRNPSLLVAAFPGSSMVGKEARLRMKKRSSLSSIQTERALSLFSGHREIIPMQIWETEGARDQIADQAIVSRKQLV